MVKENELNQYDENETKTLILPETPTGMALIKNYMGVFYWKKPSVLDNEIG